MGILAIACAATTAKHFADAQNRDLPKNNQINFISCMCAAIIGFLLLSSDTIATDAASGFNTTYLGSKGLLTAFIAAFVTGIIYKFFIKRNITVKMPEQVPPNISQTFKDIIPFSVCITVFWVFDIVFRAAFGFCFAQGVIQVFQPLFTAADGYIGLAVIYGAMSLFWFVGVHGPSIVEPAIAAALVANMTDNLAAFQAGQHASAVLTQGAQYFVVCMGGTGATLVLVFMFCFLAKSQEMRAVGKAAIVPVCFAVNEPLLFAAPIVLNPVFFVPFVFAPIANIWILKIFIDFLGMNGFMYTLPWTVPGPIGTIMGLGFQPLAFVMLALILVVDFALYYPFFRAYDAQKCTEEAEISQEELAAKNAEKAAKLNDAFQGKADAKSVAAGAAAEAVKADAKSVAAGAAAEAVKADAPAASAAPATEAATASDLNGRRVLVLCQAAVPRACSPTRWPRLPGSAVLTSRPLPRPMATTLTCSPTLTWSSWPRRPQATWPTSEGLRARGQQVRRLPWQAVHRALPERRQVSRLRKRATLEVSNAQGQPTIQDRLALQFRRLDHHVR